MKITNVETIPVNIPFKAVYDYATEQIGGLPAMSVIIKIHTDEGITGLGEGNPFHYYKEPPETIVANIDKYFSPLVLIGADPFSIDKIMARMDGLIPDQSSSKNAIVTALYDIMGKVLDVPICKLIGGYVNKTIPVAQAIPFGTPEEVADLALEWKEKGTSALKIKIGRPGGSHEDLRALELIRDVVGPEVSLRVDANESYAYKVRVLREMEKFDLDLIEQPAPRHDLTRMRMIAESLDTPILADQSIISMHDAMQVIQNEAADVLMVKNYKVGGFPRAKQLLGLLEVTHKANYLEGGAETGIGTAASLQLMGSTAKVDYWGTLNGPLLRSDDLLKEPLIFESGCFEVPCKPGLGVELDEEKLESRRVL